MVAGYQVECPGSFRREVVEDGSNIINGGNDEKRIAIDFRINDCSGPGGL